MSCVAKVIGSVLTTTRSVPPRSSTAASSPIAGPTSTAGSAGRTEANSLPRRSAGSFPAGRGIRALSIPEHPSRAAILAIDPANRFRLHDLYLLRDDPGLPRRKARRLEILCYGVCSGNAPAAGALFSRARQRPGPTRTRAGGPLPSGIQPVRLAGAGAGAGLCGRIAAAPARGRRSGPGFGGAGDRVGSRDPGLGARAPHPGGKAGGLDRDHALRRQIG